MNEKKKTIISNIVMVIFGAVLVAADQIIKAYVLNTMNLYQSHTVIKGFFEITYVKNTGAAWGIFKGQTMLLGVASLVVALLIIYIAYASKGNFLKFTLMGITAGALGNVIDRFRLEFVVDYLNFYIFGYDFPVFNLADICVTVGCVFLFIYVLFLQKPDVPVFREDTLAQKVFSFFSGFGRKPKKKDREEMKVDG